MKKLLSLLLSLTLLQSLSVQARAADGLLVIGNTVNPALELSREQVRNLFMGASLGLSLQPLALKPSTRERSLFNARVIGLTEARIQSYWAQMRFTGRMNPPREFESQQLLIDYLLQHPGSVGYVADDMPLPAGIRVLYAAE